MNYNKQIFNAEDCSRLIDDIQKMAEIHSNKSDHRQDYFTKPFQKELLQVTSDSVLRVVDRLFQDSLQHHQHCITQLMELRKLEETIEFPEVCPYAYAYVFWRKSILKEEHFYGFNSLGTALFSNFAPLNNQRSFRIFL